MLLTEKVLLGASSLSYVCFSLYYAVCPVLYLLCCPNVCTCSVFTPQFRRPFKPRCFRLPFQSIFTRFTPEPRSLVFCVSCLRLVSFSNVFSITDVFHLTYVVHHRYDYGIHFNGTHATHRRFINKPQGLEI